MGLNHLSKKLSIGRVIIFEGDKSLDHYYAMISEIYDNSVDVVFDESQSTAGEAFGIPMSKVIFVSQDIGLRKVQRSLYMNLAKCSSKRNRNGWAIKYVSIAIAISYSIRDSVEDKNESSVLVKQLSDSCYLRSKILLACNRPKLALKVRCLIDIYDHLEYLLVRVGL